MANPMNIPEYQVLREICILIHDKDVIHGQRVRMELLKYFYTK